MEERNKVIFQSYKNNILYTISTSLTGNRINLVYTDNNSKIFKNNFTIEELTRISQYFKTTHTIEQVQLFKQLFRKTRNRYKFWRRSSCS